MAATNSSEGSFCYPPRHESAESLISFMENVHIEDITLSNVSFAYNDYMRTVVDRECDAWWRDFQKSKEAKELEKDAKSIGDGRGSERYQEWMNDHLDVQRRAVAARKRMTITPLDARHIAIYGNIVRRSGSLSKAEADAVMAHEFYEPGSGRMVTVREYTDHFHTQEWLYEALTTSDLRTAKATERVWEMLNGRERW